VIRPRAQQGLTLAELLLALAITAILMAPLAAMFQSAANSGIMAEAALDLNSDVRFALDRIARRAAAVTATGPKFAPANVDAWLAPLSYKVDANRNLVESDATPKAARSSIIASNVTAFQLSAPTVTNQPLLKIDLTLEAQGGSVTASRTVRLGGPQ